MLMLDVILEGPVIAAVLAVACAGLVHGTLGIGFPLVATPLIALVTDVKTAILLTLVPTLTVNVVSIARGGRWSESLGLYWPIALYTLVGTVFGTTLLIVADPEPFKIVLAGAILFYLSTSTITRSGWGWICRYPRMSAVGFGSAAGVLAGVSNVAVPALIIYFTELRLAPLAMVQILNLCFLCGKLAQMGTFGLGGYLTHQVLLASVPLALTAVTALVVGMAVRRRIEAETYRRLLRKVLMVIAGMLIVQFWFGV
jgi:uncharacterized membrane protein YfcA